MSTYKELIGKPVKYLSSDPTDTGAEGQVWYNSTSGTFKSVTKTFAWATGSALPTALSTGFGFGEPTAAVYTGGYTGTASTNATNEYNGSAWTAGGTLNTARYEGGGETAGTLTAGIIFGGNTAAGWNGTTATEEYNGTAWTSVNPMATTVSFLGGSGTQSAAFSGGGRTPSNTNNSQEYDGTNWSNGNPINTTRQALVGLGTQTAGLIAGGEAPTGGSNSSETYDGTNWTTAPNLGTARYRISGSGSVYTASMVFGGRYNPPAADKAQTEEFNGTSWTEIGDLITARQQISGNRGSNSSAICAGGIPPGGSPTTSVEEFSGSIYSPIAATWASGGNMNTARRGIASAKNGTQNAALGAMGYTGVNTGVANAEEYDGSSWSNITSLPTSRYFGGGFGIQTAAVIFGGYRSPTQQNNTDEWNGSAWGTGGTLPSGQSNFAADGCGIENAGLATLGLPGPSPTTIHYDGSTWTIVPGTLNSTRTAGSSFGTQTAAIAATGDTPGGSSLASESYNGTVWTSTPNAIYAGYGNGCGGTQAAGFIGGTYPNGATSQGWDGSSWSAIPSLSTGRTESGGAGSATAGLVFSGATTNPTTYTAATEEYTGEIPQLNFKTLTSS